MNTNIVEELHGDWTIVSWKKRNRKDKVMAQNPQQLINENPKATNKSNQGNNFPFIAPEFKKNKINVEINNVGTHNSYLPK